MLPQTAPRFFLHWGACRYSQGQETIVQVPMAARTVARPPQTAVFRLPRNAQVVVSTIILLVLWCGSSHGACGHAGARVTGTTEEMQVACRGIALVDAFFEAAGLSYDLQVSIVFRDRVEIALGEGTSLAVLGFYDVDRSLIELVRWSAPVPEQLPWNLSWSREVVLATATHELAHAAVQAILGEDSQRLALPWQEFIAYVVQFEVMSEASRTQILERYRQAEAFPSATAVNAISYGLDPALFGLSSYLFAKERGGARFVASIISGDVDFRTDNEGPLGP